MIQPTAVPHWSPYLVYTWTRKQLAAWFDNYGSSCFYDGRLWTPVAKHLGVGRYEVRFKEYNP